MKASAHHTSVVLGADVEGLAAAATLAQAGRSVRVLDAREHAGGLAAVVELAPGHVVPGLFNECALVRRSLLAGLALEGAGLRWRASEGALHVLSGAEEPLVVERGAANVESEAYASWRGLLDRVGGLIADVLDDAPPEAVDPGLGDLLGLARTGFRLRALGNADMRELLRIVTMPAWDWTGENFRSEALRAALIAPVLAGTVLGPRAAGTTAMILMFEAARGVEPEGGTGALAAALVRRCEELGVDLQLGTGAQEILIDEGAVTGVRCTDGALVECEQVLSALDPAHTLLDLVEPGLVPGHVEAELLGWRRRGSSALHLLALGRTPHALSDERIERFVTATSPTTLERAADALKYGVLPEEPWLDVRVWRAGAQAPQGGLTLCAHVHGVPHALGNGWDDGARRSLRERTLAALEQAVPGAREAITADELLTPVDLERRFGHPGGHLHLGEQALDQLWIQRPALALSRYGTPFAGLHLGGAGSHPGGPYLGGAGILGARAALR